MSAGRHLRSPANRPAFGQKTGSDDPAGGVMPKRLERPSTGRRAVFSGAVQRSGRSTVAVLMSRPPRSRPAVCRFIDEGSSLVLFLRRRGARRIGDWRAGDKVLGGIVLPLSAAVAVPIIADAIALKAFAAMERLGVRSEREGDASFSCSLPAAWPEGAGRHQ
jgi:hypothetical protein